MSSGLAWTRYRLLRDPASLLLARKQCCRYQRLYLLCVLAFSSFTPVLPRHICHSVSVSIVPLACTTKRGMSVNAYKRTTSPLRASSGLDQGLELDRSPKISVCTSGRSLPRAIFTFSFQLVLIKSVVSFSLSLFYRFFNFSIH